MARIKGLALVLIAALAMSIGIATTAQASTEGGGGEATTSAITEEQLQELIETEKQRIA
jgi:hypothetical protein